MLVVVTLLHAMIVVVYVHKHVRLLAIVTEVSSSVICVMIVSVNHVMITQPPVAQYVTPAETQL